MHDELRHRRAGSLQDAEGQGVRHAEARRASQRSDEAKRTLWTIAARTIAKYAMPYDIEFRDELPKTLVGKVAYRVLEEEELRKLQEPAPVE